MKTHTTPMLIRALRWALGLLAAGAVFAIATADGVPAHSSPMTRIQRRTTSEAATAENAIGELTYSTDEPGTATLRVGTSDSGTVVVSDPFAIHIAPRRRLEPDEYGVTLSTGAYVRADGAYVLAENVYLDDGAVTNTITVRPVDPAVKLAEVRYQAVEHDSRMTRDLTEDRCVLTGVTTGAVTPTSFLQPGSLVVTNLTVWAWAGHVRDSVLDCETAPVPFRDQLGSTSLWGLRAWVTNRYDARTAEHWAGFPALDTVRLAGREIHYSAGGGLHSKAESGAWTYYASGVPVIRVVAGLATNDTRTAELKVLAIDIHAEGGAAIDVSASLGVPVYIDTRADLDAAWVRAPVQTSTYPNTVLTKTGLPAYRVTVPIDPSADRCFYRAAATIDDTVATRALHLGGESTALYIDGQRCAWTNIVVNGATLRVLAAQPE